MVDVLLNELETKYNITRDKLSSLKRIEDSVESLSKDLKYIGLAANIDPLGNIKKIEEIKKKLYEEEQHLKMSRFMRFEILPIFNPYQLEMAIRGIEEKCGKLMPLVRLKESHCRQCAVSHIENILAEWKLEKHQLKTMKSWTGEEESTANNYNNIFKEIINDISGVDFLVKEFGNPLKQALQNSSLLKQTKGHHKIKKGKALTQPTSTQQTSFRI